MKVYVIEHRICDLSLPCGMENVIMHVASSLEKAKEWCRNNLEIEQKIDNRPWWYVISEEQVDSDSILPASDIQIVGWDGNELSCQPIDGYK